MGSNKAVYFATQSVKSVAMDISLLESVYSKDSFVVEVICPQLKEPRLIRLSLGYKSFVEMQEKVVNQLQIELMPETTYQLSCTGLSSSVSTSAEINDFVSKYVDSKEMREKERLIQLFIGLRLELRSGDPLKMTEAAHWLWELLLFSR